MGERTLTEAAELLVRAESALFVTGAGISADSGLPTYRGVGGLYEEAQPEEGMPIETLLSGGTFSTRPELTWKYLQQMERSARGATFNAAHEAIAWLERELKRVWVLTQNVDGLHRMAGSRQVIEIHGDIHDIVCTQCGWRERVDDFDELSSSLQPLRNADDGHALPTPCCPECACIVRPDVVLFDEMLPSRKVATMEHELGRGFDVVFSIGTSSLFPYIVAPVLQARARGVPTVEINPTTTEVSSLVDVRIPLGAAKAMREIRERFVARRTGAHPGR